MSIFDVGMHGMFGWLMRAVAVMVTVLGNVWGQADLGRPVPPGGGPTVVNCMIAVTDVDAISDADQNFTVRLYSHIQWMDPREKHEGPGDVRRRVDEIWHPEISYLNRQRFWDVDPVHVQISPEGLVTMRHRLWGDFSQPLNLRDFPFDDQDFAVTVVSAGGWQPEEVLLTQGDAAGSFVSDNYSVADWAIRDARVSEGAFEIPNHGSVSTFSLIFTGDRLVLPYLIKILAPLFMIVCLSWVVFWIDPSEGSSQLGVAVTAFLTMIAFHVALSSRLPKIPYLTRLDIFVFSGTLLVFFAMIEVVITTGLANSGRILQARWTDRVCRILFPALLAASAVYAFGWH